MIDNLIKVNFGVNNQHLRCPYKPKLVRNSKNIVVFVFRFSPVWDNLKKYAIFEVSGKAYKEPLKEDNTVKVLHSCTVADSFEVSVIGEDENKDILITTEPIKFTLPESGSVDGEQSPEAKFEGLLNDLEQLIDESGVIE